MIPTIVIIKISKYVIKKKKTKLSSLNLNKKNLNVQARFCEKLS